MQILDKIEIVDLALYFDSTLVVSDIHIGYEEALNKQGILVPRTQFDEMIRKMEKIFQQMKNKKLNRIIINGDLKHEFGTISEQEWRNTLKFLDILAKHCNEIILIKGNHDTILGPIAKKRNVKVVEFMAIGKVLITHGNKVIDIIKNYETILIAHEHPAITLKDGPRVEQFKCFLKGKYKGKNLIVQPSFNPIIEGTDIMRDQVLSPFLKGDLGNFSVFIVEDKVYNFGKIRNLKRNHVKRLIA